MVVHGAGPCSNVRGIARVGGLQGVMARRVAGALELLRGDATKVRRRVAAVAANSAAESAGVYAVAFCACCACCG